MRKSHTKLYPISMTSLSAFIRLEVASERCPYNNKTFTRRLEYCRINKMRKSAPSSVAESKLTLRQGTVLLLGSWKSWTTSCLLMKTHSSSPPPNDKCSWVEKLKAERTAVVNLEREKQSYDDCVVWCGCVSAGWFRWAWCTIVQYVKDDDVTTADASSKWKKRGKEGLNMHQCCGRWSKIFSIQCPDRRWRRYSQCYHYGLKVPRLTLSWWYGKVQLTILFSPKWRWVALDIPRLRESNRVKTTICVLYTNVWYSMIQIW